MLRGLHEPEMPAGQGEGGIAAHAPEDRRAGLRGRLDEQLGVAAAPDPVVDDPRDLHAAPIAREAVDDGGGGAGHRARVDHEHDRPSGGGRDVRGRALVGGRAVEEAHDPFHDDEVRIAGRCCERGPERRLAHGPWIGVEARAAARGGVEGGVDVVRTDLERCDPHPSIPEAPQQGEGHRRLPAPRGRRRDHEPARHRPPASGRRTDGSRTPLPGPPPPGGRARGERVRSHEPPGLAPARPPRLSVRTRTRTRTTGAARRRRRRTTGRGRRAGRASRSISERASRRRTPPP